MTIQQKKASQEWFEKLRHEIIEAFLNIENKNINSGKKNKFKFKSWKRASRESQDNGGGTMGLMHGNIFEKVGVNISTVHGKFNKKFKNQIPGR